MDALQRFHDRYPTDIDDEIRVADDLHTAIELRWGDRDGRYMRANPQEVFRRYCYWRKTNLCGYTCVIEAGSRIFKEGCATNEYILTPAHGAWEEFRERLHSLLVLPDHEWLYGPATISGTAQREYWPLAAAQTLREMGFAVAESLTLFRVFGGETDRRVYTHVRKLWRYAKPHPSLTQFDVGKTF
jgi:hypothetical protein